jgi:signal transduction histidine kinase
MRLGDFIHSNSNAILAEWDVFAREIWPSAEATPQALRDHAGEILQATAHDMQSAQTAVQQTHKSQGAGDPSRSGTILDDASLDHARGRATSGFSLPEVVGEYRALRASVIRLWSESTPHPDRRDLADITRFNEAIDQSLAEAVRGYTLQVDRARQMFLAILGHDLRAPLNAMLLSAEALAEEPVLDPASVELAVQITASGKTMSRMLVDFLDFAQVQLGKTIPLTRITTDLAALCAAAVSEIKAAHPDNAIRMKTRGDLTGSWDPERLRQLLSNLLGNAVQHGASQGAIELVAEEAGSDIHLAVSNAGAPIPADLLPRIFEPLTRGISPEVRKTARSGSMGLGLYISREVVMAHGGQIAVVSALGKTTFNVSLPRQARKGAAA